MKAKAADGNNRERLGRIPGATPEQMTENQLQKAVAKLLNSTGLIWCHVPNGGKRTARTGALMKSMGAKAGIADVLIFTPFIDPGEDECDRHLNDIRGNWITGLAIELKVGKNKPTPAQLKWHEDLRRCGWRVNVCRTVDEVLAVLRECYPNKFKP